MQFKGEEELARVGADEAFLARCRYEPLNATGDTQSEAPIIFITPSEGEPIENSDQIVAWLRGHVDLWTDEQVKRATSNRELIGRKIGTGAN